MPLGMSTGGVSWGLHLHNNISLLFSLMLLCGINIDMQEMVDNVLKEEERAREAVRKAREEASERTRKAEEESSKIVENARREAQERIRELQQEAQQRAQNELEAACEKAQKDAEQMRREKAGSVKEIADEVVEFLITPAHQREE